MRQRLSHIIWIMEDVKPTGWLFMLVYSDARSCLLQYTWDKALERWVKSGMGLSKDLKAPTIQSPKEYCRRFRAAMGSYFTKVPSNQILPEPTA